MRELQLQLPVSPEAPPLHDDDALREAVAAAAGWDVADLGQVVIDRRSLDARRRRRPSWVLRVRASRRDEAPPDDALPPLLRPRKLARDHHALRPIIVGSGPAGLFAALQYADAGVRAVMLERGGEVLARSQRVRDLRVHGQLDEESNLCFGEGGAGTYSDGKLYTRGKSSRVREVYERLVALGISRKILVEAHPHVGTNRLIPMMPRLRHALREAGHELRFDAKVEDLLVDEAGAVVGVRLEDGEELRGGPVLLATGHSARDVYAMLARRGVAMERKPFAVGARVEHPQGLVDEAQLGEMAGWASVGAAEYFVSAQVPDLGAPRGVYSFCMCPGGIVLPTPTRAGHLNVNGMSNEGRNSGIANAALVTEVRGDEMYLDRPGDLDDDPEFGVHVAGGALLGLALQGALERRAFEQGGGGYRAPAQRLLEVLDPASGAAEPLPKSTYRPGLQHAPASAVLPARMLTALRRGARAIDQRQLRGYLSAEATFIPVETTTSAPVRICRGDDRQSTSHPGLYPCAEGAGYAGGIVSSAIDGMRSALATLAVHDLVPWSEVER
ncbi:MAG: hypothetical protein H6747_00030 [Deltaproteobacteria bacterium]|nr:hypothetical protein [Deltaproteobacteria bacterium]